MVEDGSSKLLDMVLALEVARSNDVLDRHRGELGISARKRESWRGGKREEGGECGGGEEEG